MAYPWRQPVRLPQMLAAPDPGPSTGGAGRELFARSARIRRRQFVAHVQEAGEARHALVRQAVVAVGDHAADRRSEEHTSALQSPMRKSYDVFCWQKKNTTKEQHHTY